MDSDNADLMRLVEREHLVVDGRSKRDAELAEHVRHVAHKLIEQRGIARRLASDLVEKRREQHAYYHGRGADRRAEWLRQHPGHAARDPEPKLLTLDEAMPLVMHDAENEIWEEAHEIGCREYAERQRRELDDVWMFIHEAESRTPSANLSRDDRALVRRGYQLGLRLMSWAMLVESGNGSETWRTSGDRPIKPIHKALASLINAIENDPIYKRALATETDERILKLKETLQQFFHRARQVYQQWKKAAGRKWAVEKGRAIAEISRAFREDLQSKVFKAKQVDAIAEMLSAVLLKEYSPQTAAIDATALVLGVTPDAAKEGAKERLKKKKPLPVKEHTDARFLPVSALDRLSFEVGSRIVERKIARAASQARRGNR